MEDLGGGLGRSRPVSRILFPWLVARPRAATISLGRRSPDASCGLPGTRRRPKPPDRTGHPRPCLALLRVGHAWPRRSPAAPVSSYLTLSPLPGSPRAVCSLLRLPRVTTPGRYPAPCPVESGLSSPTGRVAPAGAAAWPTPPELRQSTSVHAGRPIPATSGGTVRALAGEPPEVRQPVGNGVRAGGELSWRARVPLQGRRPTGNPPETLRSCSSSRPVRCALQSDAAAALARAAQVDAHPAGSIRRGGSR